MKTGLRKCLYIPLIITILFLLMLVYLSFVGGDTDFFGAILFILIGCFFVYFIYVVLLYYLFKTIVHFWHDKIERFRVLIYILFSTVLIAPPVGIFLYFRT